jgi:Flp pilus assembly protein TadG
MFTRIIALARNILQSREGAVAIHMGLIIASLIGMGALASEIGFVTYKHRQMQSAADAAAIGAAIALSQSTNANYTLQAKALTAAVGFVDGTGGVTVTVNKPPASGSGTYAGQAGYVEVIITQPWTLSVVGAVNSLTGSANPTGLFTLGVQAVAGTGLAPICMLALSTTGPAFQLNGSVTVGTPGCGIADNSASNPSTDIKGGSSTIHGQFSSNGPQNTNGNGATFDPTTPPKTGVTTIDPYIANGEKAWVLAQAAGTCSGNLNGGSAVLGKHYCTVSGTTTFSNGVYYVDSINMTGGATMTVTNATVVVFVGASFGNSTVNIIAPATPGASNQGLGLVSPNGISVSFGGNGSLQLTGAIYLPNPASQVSLAGTVNVPCAQVIAGTISLSGNDQFGNDGTCGLAKITTPGSAKLVQ